MSGARQVFPEAFKREAVDSTASRGLSVGEVAVRQILCIFASAWAARETLARAWVETWVTAQLSP